MPVVSWCWFDGQVSLEMNQLNPFEGYVTYIWCSYHINSHTHIIYVYMCFCWFWFGDFCANLSDPRRVLVNFCSRWEALQISMSRWGKKHWRLHDASIFNQRSRCQTSHDWLVVSINSMFQFLVLWFDQIDTAMLVEEFWSHSAGGLMPSWSAGLQIQAPCLVDFKAAMFFLPTKTAFVKKRTRSEGIGNIAQQKKMLGNRSTSSGGRQPPPPWSFTWRRLCRGGPKQKPPWEITTRIPTSWFIMIYCIYIYIHDIDT